jgi:hypothetical protein
MLFTARSERLLGVLKPFNQEGDKVVTSIGKAVNRPWFVATYMRLQGNSNWWETICTEREDDFLLHVRQIKRLKFAAVQYIEPPESADFGAWRCHRLHAIEKGQYRDGEVSIYTLGQMERRCIEYPEVDLDQIASQRTVLEVALGHFY